MEQKKTQNNKKRSHSTPGTRRINRRLSEEIKKDALSTEPERQASSQNKKPIKKGKTLPFLQLKRKSSKKMAVLKITALLVTLAVVATMSSLAIFLNMSTQNDDLWLDLAQIPYKTETTILYTNALTGETGVYATLPCTQDKIYIEGEAIPQSVKDAFVAIEDKKFYKHNGVDVKRTIYAMLNEMKHLVTGSYIGGESGMKQGASTIDQQLVKNLTRDDGDSNMAGYLRKIREIYRSFKMDSQYEKDIILNAYLNTISFTGNTAGVEAEAQKIFGKSVQELTLAESASLAAITRNPARYDPVSNPEYHVERRNYVLYEMWQEGYISEDDYTLAIAEPLTTIEQGSKEINEEVTSYFTDALMDEVIDVLMKERAITKQQATDLLYNGGLQIYATVVPEVQQSMEKVMEQSYLFPRPPVYEPVAQTDEEGNPLLDANGKQIVKQEAVLPQAAMVSIDYEGGIVGVVGGLGEKEISRGFNRATSGVRQVGSTMKPIGPYVVALENNKITWSTPFYDGPVRKIKDENTDKEIDWPQNVDRIYSERDILVREALARSVNTVAVRVGDTAGNSNMYRFTKNTLGITTFTSKDKDSGPLVLGSSTYGITPLEMANSYAMFGNGGKVPTSHTFTKIESGAGREILVNQYPLNEAIGEDTAYIMNKLLREVLLPGGTASGMSVQGEMESTGKTGTTSDNRDHWFIGLTPYYVTATWYGYDDNQTLYVNNFQHPPTLAWRTVMQQSQQNLPYKEFPQAAGVVQEEYCLLTGAHAGANCPKGVGYYKEGHLPESVCSVHG